MKKWFARQDENRLSGTAPARKIWTLLATNPLRNMASGCVYGKLLSLNPAVDHIDLTRRETILGRSAPLCDVVFDDLQVSKQHCKIICSDAGVFIRDLRYDIALFHVVAMVRAVV